MGDCGGAAGEILIHDVFIELLHCDHILRALVKDTSLLTRSPVVLSCGKCNDLRGWSRWSTHRYHAEIQPHKVQPFRIGFFFGLLYLSLGSFCYSRFMMVHYIRFLKTPKIKTTNTRSGAIKSLITITNDLGDDLYQGDLKLEAELFPSGAEKGAPSMQKQFMWTSGMRTLWIEMERIPIDVCCSIRLHIFGSNPLVGTSLLMNFPDILSAWSQSFGIMANIEAGKRVERRLELSSGTSLSIFEDLGESIARHIWWVSRLTNLPVLIASGMLALHCLPT